MSLNIDNVELSKNPVSVGETLILKVTIVTHRYLGLFTHTQLGGYTHKQLKDRGETDDQ